MPWPFERGRVYNRRKDIHARYPGQQQGGIITPAQHPLVIIITGEEGQQHGYADCLREDGIFEYFGEGQVGDMLMQSGNRAIAEHSKRGRSLLLFRKQSTGGLRFEGEWVCAGVLVRRGPDRNGTDRSAFVFELEPLDSIQLVAEEEGSGTLSPLDVLRAAAFAAAQPVAASIPAARTVFQRSKDVRAYVLARAAAMCEGCEGAAPFKRKDGTPYLEPHHLRRVSDGGPDDPCFVIALCPNCHRRVHFGDDGFEYNQKLEGKMPLIETQS